MIVIAQKTGQLGNRLMLFAHFIAAAIEHDLKIANLAFDEYAGFFQDLDRDPLCRFPAVEKSAISQRFASRLFRESQKLADRRVAKNRRGRFIDVLRLTSGQNYDLDSAAFAELARRAQFLIVQGWGFRAYPSLTKHTDKIREFFVPQPKFDADSRAIVDSVRKQDVDIVVGVHVRQGDYRNWLGGRFFFSTDQYLNVERSIEAAFPDKRVGFLICSDTRQDPANFRRRNHTFGDGHLMTDLCTLAKCDFLAGPPSTFTQWASFWGQVPLYAIESPDSSIAATDFRIFPAYRPSTCDTNAGVGLPVST